MSEWEVRMSNSKGLPYFYNTNTHQSMWEQPKEMTLEEVSKLPGAEHLNQGRSGEVRASHLLVKHRDSRRPSSWKEVNITRTKEEAVDILKEYQAEIGTSADKFAELARQHSDCSSYSKSGDLGWFSHGQMQKAFEDATYGLVVGQISGVIATDSGVHLIMRTG